MSVPFFRAGDRVRINRGKASHAIDVHSKYYAPDPVLLALMSGDVYIIDDVDSGYYYLGELQEDPLCPLGEKIEYEWLKLTGVDGWFDWFWFDIAE